MIKKGRSLFRGFILHIVLNDQIVIFDEDYGRYQLKVPRDKYAGLMVGALISYSSIIHKKTTLLYHADMIQVPLALARYDVRFLYQVLDICLLGMPSGVALPEIFYILQSLFALEQPCFSGTLKKRILLKILWLLDIYVENMLYHPDMMDYLHSASVEDILKENYTIGDALLQKWLQACLTHVKNVDIWE